MADQHRKAHLLKMPRELRDQIYHDYLWLSNGYAYNFDERKLRVSDEPHGKQRPIELSLMYTCQLLADEMRGLPLRLNTVNFYTTSFG